MSSIFKLWNTMFVLYLPSLNSRLLNDFGLTYSDENPLKMNWYDADLYCSTQCNSHLASIHSIEDINDVIKLTSPYNITNIWIGFSSLNGHFQWIDAADSNYTNWGQNEPSGAHQCVQMLPKQNGTWQVKDCNNSNTAFLCNSCKYNNPSITSTYHLSFNIYPFDKSRIFCSGMCNSDLASVHNAKDAQILFNKAKNDKIINSDWSTAEKSVRIGLFHNDSHGHFWLDHTPFNYVNNSNWAKSYWPWDRGQPDDSSGITCTHLRANFDYMWDDNEVVCGLDNERFFCNSCDSYLNKYIFTNKGIYPESKGDTYCNTQFGTNLASMHSMNDFLTLQRLCSLGSDGIPDYYLIGLNKDSGQYQWTDGTTFDFGSDLSDTVIWSDSNGYNCVDFSEHNGYRLHSHACGWTTKVICNAPSLLCDIYESYWNNNLSMTLNWKYIGDFNCEISSDLVSNVNAEAVMISNKQWINTNGVLKMEYIHQIVAYTMDSTSGIMIFNFIDVMCDFYYIYFKPDSNRLYLQRNFDGNAVDLSYCDLQNTFDNTRFYVLHIEITNGSVFNIRVNDNSCIDYVDTTFSDYVYNQILSGYIGIKNQASYSLAKSLYISGYAWNMDDISIINQYGVTGQCTNSPTVYPTTIPTTSQPTSQPTNPTTTMPTAVINPTTSKPTTSFPTTVNPTTSNPTAQNTTTAHPTTINPTTFYPSIFPTKHTKTPTENPTARTTTFEDTNYESGEIDIYTTIANRFNDDNKKSDTNGSNLMLFYIIGAVALCMCIIGISILIRVKKKNESNGKVKNVHIASEINSGSPISQNTSKISEEPQYLTHLSSAVVGSNMIMDDIVDEMDVNNNITAGGPMDTNDITLNENQYGEGNEDEDEEIIEMCNMVTNGGEDKINNIVNKNHNMGSTTMSPLSVASMSHQSDYNVVNDSFMLSPTKGNPNIKDDEFIVKNEEQHTKGYIASEYHNENSNEQEYVTKGNEYEDDDIVDI